MSGVGRGRGRGRGRGIFGRGIAEPSGDVEVRSIIVGRGISMSTTDNVQPILNVAGRGKFITCTADQTPNKITPSTNAAVKDKKILLGEEKKTSLQKELRDYGNTGKGCLFKISMNYFSSEDNIEFYIDTMMNQLLDSASMVEPLAKSFKLLTLLKNHGENIKLAMFSKLQSTYHDINLLMEDVSKLIEQERMIVTNFCDLMGQLYFRFRVHLYSPERYSILAAPVAQCMTHLLALRGVYQLRVLVKLIMFNYKALCQQDTTRMKELSLDIRSALLDGRLSGEELSWLLCASDLTGVQEGTPLPPHLITYYNIQLGKPWTDISSQTPATGSPKQLLADIPLDIIDSLKDRFNVLHSDYNVHKFIES